MKAEELRIGNVVGLKQANIDLNAGKVEATIQQNLFLCYIVGIMDTHVVCKVPSGYLNCTYEQINPIPIDKHWLDGYGFKEDPELPTLYHHENFSVFLYAVRPSVMLHKCKPSNINYRSVHELQNIYFALKQKELRLKE